MKFWSRMSLLAALAAGASLSASPTVDNVRLTQSADRTFTVLYDLSDGPAVVTVDFKIGGVSIGGGRIMADPPTGDVWKKVATGDDRSIVWRPGLACADIASGDVVAEVSAYPTDDPPDYMVVSLAEVAADRVRFYPSAEFVPGGVLGNTAYRTSELLMRKIPAKGVTWTMGTEEETGKTDWEDAHEVCLDSNYYIGVFELTQGQWQCVAGTLGFDFSTEGLMRPANGISYYQVRENSVRKGVPEYEYPQTPNAVSFMGKLRDLTGNVLDFDLPGEAQWEYACRAGHGQGLWGDGSAIRSDTKDGNLPGRYQYSPGTTGRTYDKTDGPTNGVAVCGSYAPNSWGIYDMHGNVREWCLDWLSTDISAYRGAVVASTNDAHFVSTGTYGARVLRGGGWYYPAGSCRSGYRANAASASNNNCYIGFRIACPAKLND